VRVSILTAVVIAYVAIIFDLLYQNNRLKQSFYVYATPMRTHAVHVSVFVFDIPIGISPDNTIVLNNQSVHVRVFVICKDHGRSYTTLVRSQSV